VEAHRHRPTILHFAGHGDDRSLSFITDQGLVANTTPLIGQQLVAILGNFPDRIRLCVLNTCNSATVAQHLVDSDVADATIGWPDKIDDAAAITFSRTLYSSLGSGLTLSQSVTLANESHGSKEHALLFTNKNIVSTVFAFVERTKE
jgi:phosphoglycerate-specific signal transduction histidine kinase